MMSGHYKARRVFYGVILFFTLLTGFAQMPIFDRYYVSSVPGLGWLAQFFVTHLIHYGMAALLVGLGAYAVVDYLLARRLKFGRPVSPARMARLMPGIRPTAGTRTSPAVRLSGSGWVRAACLAGLMITGALMVVKNLPGVYFAHGLIIALNLAHLGLAVVLAGVTVYCLVQGRPWLSTCPPDPSAHTAI
jgi:hypothetical protein